MKKGISFLAIALTLTLTSCGSFKAKELMPMNQMKERWGSLIIGFLKTLRLLFKKF
jgi:hypothetical protein